MIEMHIVPETDFVQRGAILNDMNWLPSFTGKVSHV